MARSADDESLLALARTVVGVSTRAADQLGGVSIVQLRALTVLRDLGTANLGRLAEDMGVALSTASRLVDRLVRAGLIERVECKEDARGFFAAITDEGRRVFDEARGTHLDGVRERFLSHFSAAELRTLGELFARVGG